MGELIKYRGVSLVLFWGFDKVTGRSAEEEERKKRHEKRVRKITIA